MPNAYCLKCRDMVTIQNPERVVLKNGAVALRGVCPVSGTTVFRFVTRRMGPIYALELAIEREREAAQLYGKAAKLTVHPHGKAMYRWLVGEETWHQTHLESQLRARFDRSAWLEWEEKSSPISISEFPQTSEASGEFNPSAEEIQVLNAAIKSERQSIELYKQNADITTDPAGRTMFTSLAVQEEGHLALLQKQLERLKRRYEYFVLVRFTVTS